MHRHDLCTTMFIHVQKRVLKKPWGWSEIYLLLKFLRNLFLRYIKKSLEKRQWWFLFVCLTSTLWWTNKRYSENEWFPYVVLRDILLKSIFQCTNFNRISETSMKLNQLKLTSKLPSFPLTKLFIYSSNHKTCTQAPHSIAQSVAVCALLLSCCLEKVFKIHLEEFIAV